MNAIDTIADKLGVVADDFMQLVPKMTHYEMVKLEVTALLCAIIFVICVIAAVWGHKHDSIYNESILPPCSSYNRSLCSGYGFGCLYYNGV